MAESCNIGQFYDRSTDVCTDCPYGQSAGGQTESCTACKKENTDFLGEDLGTMQTGFTFDGCEQHCRDLSGCKAFTFQASSGNCWPKSAEFTPEESSYQDGVASANLICLQGKFKILTTTLK